MSTTKSASFPTWSFDQHCKSMEWNALSKVKIIAGGTSLDKADLIVVGIHNCTLSGWAKSLDNGSMKGALQQTIDQEKKSFSKCGYVSPILRMIDNEESVIKRYALLSLGDNNQEEATIGLTIGKALATLCTAEKNAKIVSVHLPAKMLQDANILQDLAAAIYSELYVDNRYRTGDNIKTIDLTEIKLMSSDEQVSSYNTAPLEVGKSLASGVILTKDIVNAPHNILNSESLADTAQRVAKESNGRIKCTILGKAECEERGMGAYLGVARGSETQPQFLHLVYSPPDGDVKKKVGIVGKGLLFDTGGYNIKNAMMELMKFDCGGAAAVLGAARALGAIAPSHVEAHFCIAACENMINDRAMVPSDILTASNGKTIEVLNTDAEGRLTLADALVYVDKELGCERIIELSTLTGSCMIALGTQICGVFTQSDELAQELDEISKVTGEKAWRLPMPKEYNEQLESKIADLKNIGGRFGGSITAALFLQNFVDTNKPFAHIDIAGPTWSHEKSVATGFGARLVAEWVTRQGK